ncbi:Zn(II)2Cys6 transcription factor [Aspergillus steynii IBT 23096]|uniref:Zn(II)2Cys6 transcription factor n=1 Tax=Aspergillus steynii IBT 23096 TaxID=1392250 RepID=A0A2I2GEU0_9EURO|nr:Zn(II)2Cys6 transcription factor [Aspergillus steynii IBT 23096]PLB51390.1 Zn(II)2Cys6 transcription factor [Aspergillus steynii IBT 23096]
MFPEDDSIRPLRSRLGCKTCKARRVKCGQEKPTCVRCSSTGRQCEYRRATTRTFSSAPATRTVLDHPLSSSPNTVWRERRAFAYYFHRAAVSVGGELDVDFWRSIIPQVCRAEPAVWDAMIALSSLLESPELCPDVIAFRRPHPHSLNDKQRDALGWYSRSVAAVRRHLETGGVDIFVGLVTCVLFICIEALMGGLPEAVQLYDQGVRLILALRSQIACGLVSEARASLLEDTIVPIFVRLGMLSTRIVALPVSALLTETKHPLTPWFPSLKAAREAIVALAAEVQLFEETCNGYLLASSATQVTEELMMRQQNLSTRLEGWHSAFTKFMNSSSATDLPPHQRISIGALLLTYYDMSFVILVVCVSRSRIAHDACLQNFRNIVEQSSIVLNDLAPGGGTAPSFTCEIGVGFPLWFTCLRCSDPTTRRTALALLRRAHRVQGFNNRDHGAMVGKWVIMLEETYGMALSAAQARRGAIALGSRDATNEERSQSQEMDDLSSLLGSLDIKLAAGASPSAAIQPIAPSADLVPEEARIRPHGVFRPRDGFPQGTSEADLTRWSRSSDQTFLQFSRTVHDRSNDTWQVIYSYIPIDF